MELRSILSLEFFPFIDYLQVTMKWLFYKSILSSLFVLLFAYTHAQIHTVHMSALSDAQLWDVKKEKPARLNFDADEKKLLVLIFLSPECPLCKNYSLVLNALQKEYASSVQFTGIIPGKAYSSSDVNDYISKYKIGFDILIDTGKLISGKLHATVTPEVFLLGSQGDILYYGAIDNWIKQLGMQSAKPTEFYLHDAIKASLSNKPVAMPFRKPVGCLINDY